LGRPRAIEDLETKPPQTGLGLIHDPVFGTDALFIGTKNKVRAQSAQ
jgi:hypothetical protein